ncbi:MAG: flagellar biosynthetic protein FliR, partial [Sulfurospirillaceae bacterium]|nr:flagellar biosynthetic protein FliR [Sulfurospirillaceae bacterium]
MSWPQIFSDTYIVGFILLFFRFAALFMAVPIFSHNSIPVSVKTSMAFFFTIVFYSSMPPLAIPITVPSIIIAILSELLFGLAIGVILQIAFN